MPSPRRAFCTVCGDRVSASAAEHTCRACAGRRPGCWHGRTRLVPSLKVFGSRLWTVQYSSSPAVNCPLPKAARRAGFLGVEDVVEVHVVAVEERVVRAADDEAEFVDRFHEPLFDGAGGDRRARHVVAAGGGSRAAGAGRGAPGDDGLREVAGHVGQQADHVEVGPVEVELGSLVHQAEVGLVTGIGAGGARASGPWCRCCCRS